VAGKNQRLQMRISGSMKQRFLQCLEYENLKSSDILSKAIKEFVERTEEKFLQHKSLHK
jgi:hypothetical protein